MDNLEKKLMLGGNIFGHFTSESETHDILDCAQSIGVNAIDTADVYSAGISEKIIGSRIKKDRTNWFIASKVGLQSYANPAGIGTKENIQKKIEETLKRLQTDYLDLYQIHHFDPVTPLEETIEAFNQLLREGKILSAGISNYNAHHLQLLQNQKNQVFKFHQLPLNLSSFTRMAEVLRASQDMELIAYSCLARGLFDEKYLADLLPPDSRAFKSQNVRNDLTQEFITLLKKTHTLGIQHKVTITQIALQFVALIPKVKFTIVGVRNKEQLLSAYENLKKPYSLLTLTEAIKIWEPTTF